MSVRLGPAYRGKQDYHDICDRLHEARVSTGVKITIDRVDETSAVAERLGLDPTPLQAALGIPTAKQTWEIPRRELDRREVKRLYEFCEELVTSIDEVVAVQEMFETIKNLPEDESWEDRFDQLTVEYYDASVYARTLTRLCEKSLEWGFELEIE